MNGVESTTSAGGMVCAVFGRRDSRPESRADGGAYRSGGPLDEGPLALARNAVREELGSTGFIDVTGTGLDNFKVFLHPTPIQGMDIEDLKPGLLNDVASWAASQIRGHPDEALRAQGRVRPPAALKLLR